MPDGGEFRFHTLEHRQPVDHVLSQISDKPGFAFLHNHESGGERLNQLLLCYENLLNLIAEVHNVSCNHSLCCTMKEPSTREARLNRSTRTLCVQLDLGDLDQREKFFVVGSPLTVRLPHDLRERTFQFLGESCWKVLRRTRSPILNPRVERIVVVVHRHLELLLLFDFPLQSIIHPMRSAAVACVDPTDEGTPKWP